VEEDVGLSVGAAWIAGQDRSMWRTLRPSAGQAQQWVSEWQQWSLLNCFRTEQGHCGACRRKWRLSDTDLCHCGETQTMSHIFKFCPLGPDKTEWRLISGTLCRWRRCFVAVQLSSMTRIREVEDGIWDLTLAVVPVCSHACLRPRSRIVRLRSSFPGCSTASQNVGMYTAAAMQHRQ